MVPGAGRHVPGPFAMQLAGHTKKCLQSIYAMFDGITSTVVESDPSMKSRCGMAAGACNPPANQGTVPEDCCTISSADCLPMPNFEGKPSVPSYRRCRKSALDLVPGILHIITLPFPPHMSFDCPRRVASGGRRLSSVIRGRRRAVQPIAAGGGHVILLLPVSDRRGACRRQWRPGPRAGGDEAVEKGPPSQTSDEEAATSSRCVHSTSPSASEASDRPSSVVTMPSRVPAVFKKQTSAVVGSHMDRGDRRGADLHMEYLCTASRSTPLGPGRLVLPCPPSTFDGGAKAEKRGRCRGGVGCPR